MALSLNKIDDTSSIDAKYHRIKTIERLFGKTVKVTVLSYKDITNRNIEKQIEELVPQDSELKERYSQLNNLLYGDLEEEERVSLEEEREDIKDKIKLLDDYLSQYVHYYNMVQEFVVTMDEDEDISFPNVYNRLKQEGYLPNATNI